MKSTEKILLTENDDDPITDVRKILHFNKGDIYICQLDEEDDDAETPFFSKSGLIGKTRPCMIFSTLEYNDEWRNTYTVIPIKTNNTDKSTKEYIEHSPDIFVPLWMNGIEKLLMINQARPLNARRIRSYVGTITNQDVLAEVDKMYLQCHFGLKNDIDKIYNKYGSTDEIIKFLSSNQAFTCYDKYIKNGVDK